MLPNHYVNEVQFKRQEFEREAHQRRLVQMALTRAARGDQRTGYPREWLARLGAWMIRRGEYLESRYNAYNETVVAARSTADAC